MESVLISQKHLQAFDQEVHSQGWIGKAWDSAKCTFGSSQVGKAWYDPRAVWSHFLDWDCSSEAIKRRIQENQAPEDALASYRNSQKNGVEGITDAAAGIVSGTTYVAGGLASAILRGSIAGALTKVTLKRIDGKYADLGGDICTGGLMGALSPVAELAGANVSRRLAAGSGLIIAGDGLAARIATQGTGLGTRLLSAGAKSGTAGAVFGAIENPMRDIYGSISEGGPLNARQLALKSIEGAVAGFLFGTALGTGHDLLSDRFRRESSSRAPISSAEGQIALPDPKPNSSVPALEALPETTLKSILEPHKLAITKQDLLHDYLRTSVNHPRWSKIDQIIEIRRGQPKPDSLFGSDTQLRRRFEPSKPWKRAEDVIPPNLAASSAHGDARAARFFSDVRNRSKRREMNLMVDGIYQKFNPEPISLKELRDVLNQFDYDKRLMALALLEQSAENLSDTNVLARLADIPVRVNERAFTLTPSSAGNFLGYLYKKSRHCWLDMYNLESSSVAKLGRVAYNFDDLTTIVLDDAQRRLLRSLQNEEHCSYFSISLDGFEKGMNFLDVALGQEAFARKLQGLVAEASEIQGNIQRCSSESIAKKMLSETTDIGQARVYRAPCHQPSIVNPSASFEARITAIHERMTIPRVSKADIARYFMRYSRNERQMLLNLLLNGTQFNSFKSMVDRARAIHRRVGSVLDARKIAEKDFFLISDFDSGGSAHMVSYLYKHANNLSDRNVISMEQFRNMTAQRTRPSSPRAVAFADDTIYSGMQISGRWSLIQGGLSTFDKSFILSLGAYPKGIKNVLTDHGFFASGHTSIFVPEILRPLRSKENPFYQALRSKTKARLDKLSTHGGYRNTDATLIWPYITPDNNNGLIDSFAKQALKIAGP